MEKEKIKILTTSLEEPPGLDNMPQVSIIILTFNSSKYIESLIESLQEFKNTEILVVDNASRDETIKIVEKFKEVKIFKTGSNLGFSKGINFGAEKAKGEFLLFINPDSVFKNGNLDGLLQIFKEKENVGAVGGKMMSFDGNDEKSAGKFFNFFETVLLAFGLDEKFGVRFSPNHIKKVDFVSGGFMMISASLFKKLNGFDENFFMYIEDMELCFRIKKMGFDNYFTPESVVSHVGQGSSNKSFAIKNIYKGILYFYKKHKNRVEYILIKLLFSLKAISVYAIGILTNNSYYKNTYKDAFLSIK